MLGPGASEALRDAGVCNQPIQENSSQYSIISRVQLGSAVCTDGSRAYENRLMGSYSTVYQLMR